MKRVELYAHSDRTPLCKVECWRKMAYGAKRFGLL
jgi:hypothetical protein